ncbi:MAG: HBL/NHE enterotoxin family protein [Candidatus Aquirickettsiella sp.]
MLNSIKTDADYCTQVPANKIDSINTLSTVLGHARSISPYKQIKESAIDFSFLSLRAQDDYLKKLSNQSIIPKDTECYSSANFSQGAIVQNYCVQTTTQAIVMPPDTEFNNVSKIQEDAQDHANLWLSNLNGKVVGINSNGKQYCNLIITYENDIDNLIDDVVNNISGAKDNFVSEIGLLKDEAVNRSKKITAVTNGLNDFRVLISGDGSAFQSIKQQADIKYNSNTGEMKQLKDAMDALETAISTYNAIIAGGAAVVVIGALVIAVGVLLELPSAGASSAIIAAGTLITAGGSTAIGIATEKRDESSEKLKERALRYNTLQQTCALLQTVSGQLSNLITGNIESVQAVQAMAVAYQLIATNLEGIIENVDSLVGNTDSGAMLKRMLKVFVQNGKDLKDLYVKYEANGILPVQPSNTVWNALHTFSRKTPAFPGKPISMEEYLILIQRKIAWQRRRRRGVYVPTKLA